MDQASELGFEMLILSFGSGFNLEKDTAEHRRIWKEVADYGLKKGIVMGSYSLLSSRSAGAKYNCVEGEQPIRFGQAPCLGSEWATNYFNKIRRFYAETGMGVFEHDGYYPSDACASTKHPGHKNYNDSVWKQRKVMIEFYREFRAKGIYLAVPDSYHMNGSSKNAMGYNEENWSRPRSEQLLHVRQHIYDGTWEKTPSMGWMFTPLTNYKGGGKAASYEPLEKSLDDYTQVLGSLWGMGVQSSIRGHRLYDTPKTKAMVKGMLDWYKKYRAILESNIIHGRRADGKDIDWILHVNPKLKRKGMLVAYNPLKEEMNKIIKVPLYYTGLTDRAIVKIRDKNPETMTLNRDYSINLKVTIPANSMIWVVFEE